MARKPELKTHKEVQTAEAGTHPVLPGLKYKSNGDGTGSWLARYSIAGKESALGLGPFPEVSLADARNAHKDNRAKVRMGVDPRKERDNAVATHRAEHRTVEATVRDAHAAFVPGWKNGGKGNGFMPKMEAYVFPAVGTLPMAELNGTRIAAICEPFWQDQKSIADKILAHLSKVITWAAARKETVDRMAVKDAREILGTSRYRETPTRAMDWQAVPSFYQTLGESPSDLGLRFYMLTATRTANAAEARWDEVEDNLWYLDAERMKRAEDHSVPLSEEAMRVLDLAARFNPKRTGYIFANPKSWKTGHVSPNSWTQQMRRHKIDATAHGMRTAFKMWGTINGVASDTILEECLHHQARGKVERAYLRGHLTELRRPVFEAWATFLTSN